MKLLRGLLIYGILLCLLASFVDITNAIAFGAGMTAAILNEFIPGDML